MSWLRSLSGDLEPIREASEMALAGCNDLDESIPGLVRFAHRPALGKEWYAALLFQGVGSPIIARYEELHSIRIPLVLKAILGQLNGASLFQLNFFGIPHSMAQDPPLLDRTQPQPLDVATANHFWRGPFDAPSDSFHFASAPLSLQESVGYFLSPSGVASFRKGGEVVGTWSSIRSFLSAELVRCAALYDDFEKFLVEARSRPKRQRGRGDLRRTY